MFTLCMLCFFNWEYYNKVSVSNIYIVCYPLLLLYDVNKATTTDPNVYFCNLRTNIHKENYPDEEIKHLKTSVLLIKAYIKTKVFLT